MPLKYFSADNMIEVILDPDFSGDLQELASKRVVWIVDSPGNQPVYEEYLKVANKASLCEVNRYIVPYPDPSDRERNLSNIVIALDTHYYPYAGLIVHGAKPSVSVTRMLANWGFEIDKVTPDGFIASAI